MTGKIISALFLPSSMSDDVAKKTLIDEPSGANAGPVATVPSEQPTGTSCKGREARKEMSKVAERQEAPALIASASSDTVKSTRSDKGSV